MHQSEMAISNYDIEVFQKDPSCPKESRPDLAQIMKFAYAYRASMLVDATTIPAPTGLPELRKAPDRCPHASPDVAPMSKIMTILRGVKLPLAVPRGIEPLFPG